jgi:hypothetical protein
MGPYHIMHGSQRVGSHINENDQFSLKELAQKLTMFVTTIKYW